MGSPDSRRLARIMAAGLRKARGGGKGDAEKRNVPARVIGLQGAALPRPDPKVRDRRADREVLGERAEDFRGPRPGVDHDEQHVARFLTGSEVESVGKMADELEVSIEAAESE